MLENIARKIGEYVGVLQEANTKNFNGEWWKYMRIKVGIDIRLPLQSTMKIKNKGGARWMWNSSMNGWGVYVSFAVY